MLIARALLMTLLPALSVFAQADPVRPAESGQATPMSRSETNLVLVRFQMAPKKGVSNDLRPEDIELREDGVVRKIAVFQGGQLYPKSIPVEINLLFDDLSRSEPIRRGVKPSWMNSWKLDIGAIDDRGIASIAVWALGQNLVRLTPPTRDASMLDRAMEKLWDIWSAPYAAEPRLLATIAAIAGTANQGRTNVVRTITVVTRGCNVEQEDGAAKAVEGIGATIFPLMVRRYEALAPTLTSEYSRVPSAPSTGRQGRTGVCRQEKRWADGVHQHCGGLQRPIREDRPGAPRPDPVRLRGGFLRRVVGRAKGAQDSGGP